MKIKPCPFCGSEDLDYENEIGGRQYVRCLGCRCCVSRKHWNTRPIEDKLQKELDMRLCDDANNTAQSIAQSAEIARLTKENTELKSTNYHLRNQI
jgi:hypothetical protein